MAGMPERIYQKALGDKMFGNVKKCLDIRFDSNFDNSYLILNDHASGLYLRLFITR